MHAQARMRIYVRFYLSLNACYKYDWEIHKGHLEVFDKYGFRYIFDISDSIALDIFLDVRQWITLNEGNGVEHVILMEK
jgi:hypothetical protein